jgi:hypothetical protein
VAAIAWPRDHEVLSELTEADLEKPGVPMGHRKRLVRAIAALSAGSAAAADVPAAEPATGSAAERRQLTVMFQRPGRLDGAGGAARSQRAA